MMEEKDINAVGAVSGSGETASDPGETTVRKAPLKERIENFWYHYKWHSIVAVIAVIAVTVCSLQMCTRKSYDIYITYAGYYQIERTGSGGSSPYSEAVKSLSRICEDYNGDGEVAVSLQTLFVVNEEEKAALLDGKNNYEINEALVKEDGDTLRSALIFGEHYVCFLSERLFKEYDREFNGELFISLSELAPEGAVLADGERAVYLSSLNAARLPVLASLPADTVICVRKLSEVSQTFGKAENEKNYSRGVEFMKKLFSYQ